MWIKEVHNNLPSERYEGSQKDMCTLLVHKNIQSSEKMCTESEQESLFFTV